MIKVLGAAQSRHLEECAVQAGARLLDLMENAGSAAVRFLRKKYDLEQKRCVVLCGLGNNGGDGFVAARRLQECGAHVIVILMEGLPSTDNARHMYGMLDDTGVKVLRYEEASSYLPSMVESADFILDAVYGVGFHGSAPQFMEPVFRAVTNSRGVTLALDVPSGVNCDTGAVEGPCVMADYTVSFSTLKNGHLLQPAKGCCGQVVVVPIGIDLSLINAQESPLEVTDTELAQRVIKPRNPESNKGDYGRLLCLCGSEGMAGAASLCARAALRGGAGLVNVVLPRSIYPIVAAGAQEAIYTLLDYAPSGALTGEAQTALAEALAKADAMVLGCGLGTGREASALLRQCLMGAEKPIVIDADGINLLARNIDILKTVQAPLVLTPHPGEMARLTGRSVKEIQLHRLEFACSFAREYNVVLVLKGAGTIVASPAGHAWVNQTGNAGMAKGGSGDVLAGLTGALLAQGCKPEEAAAAAVWLHGTAGDRCAARLSQTAMLPADLIGELPGLFLEIGR